MNTSNTATTDTNTISPPSSLYTGNVKRNGTEPTNESGQLKIVGKSNSISKFDKTAKDVVSKEEASDIVENLYELTDMLQTSLTFQVDEKSDSVVIKVIDKKNNGVIRQIPNEDILKLREKMDEMTGLLLSESV
ncbi:FlaG [Desulforapulum autotrophicum HRM2]|uniref:FlaG n=1 Tax=Desulforapulum autotrophicum (strain ATCC 43914 / DSM 3382 / VKM B-1955 / HRM2) TaxID=177437 RepID=C0QA32_DESAH|nr:flagellar protein FlaG [Desulforapulum autotrophicum]ACN16750.1 FlaG [Desulforapulum autotrophicum HRM2]